jgi:hypothetical protein
MADHQIAIVEDFLDGTKGARPARASSARGPTA